MKEGTDEVGQLRKLQPVLRLVLAKDCGKATDHHIHPHRMLQSGYIGL